jgi:hypothetical protein
LTYEVPSWVVKVVPAIFIVAGSACLAYGLRAAYTGYRATKWPHVQGRVVSAGVEKLEGGKRTTWRPNVTYEYAVNRTEYSSNTIKPTRVALTIDEPARKVVSRYSVGSRVTVYYDPDDPAQSLLEPEVPWESYVFLMFGLVFAGLGVLGVYGLREVQHASTSSSDGK